jgi:nucleoside-diphosphate-sugar epimerase
MMIAVTGATGFLGRQVAASLVAAGHQVRGLDSRPSDDGSVDSVVVDLRDQDATRTGLECCDGIVHLAGYPRAGDHSPHDVFTTNTAITFAVTQAALDLGIRLLVNVSSVSVLGYPFYTRLIIPEYLPVDENAGTGPQDAYGLSKAVGEEIISAAVQQSDRRFAAVSLRMPWLQCPETFWRDIPGAFDDGMDVRNLWGYLDIRDAASAVVAVFARENVGHTRLFIAADDTFSERDTMQLIADFFPNVAVRSPLPGNSSIISTAAARDYLGFVPQYSWSSYPRAGK